MKAIKSLKKVFKLNKEPIEAPALRQKVREVYSEAAINPKSELPFPIGRSFAEQVGYPKELLDSLPGLISESFVGVSNVSIYAEIPEAATVLDIGCGAGLDSIIAAEKTGEKGKVVGIDFSKKMVEKAKKSISLTSYKNIEFHNAPAESLPFQSRSFDIVLANGIFNLNPFRDKIFKEIKRVLKCGGGVYASEVIFAKPREHPDNVVKINDWFA
jgi:SAM-dependent methyltransferase